ncbi:Exportin-1, partial [Durusdinium trenchii]
SSSSRLLVELHQGGHFWPGRLYELHLLVAHGSEPQPNQSWRLKTESFKEESWHPVDVGEIVGYNLVPALEWNVTLAPSRLLPLRSGRGHCRAAVAGGSLGAVTISLQLGAAGVEDLFEIHPPKGITVASCDVTEVAPAEEEGIDVQMTSCGDPGALRLSWETETSVALSTEPPSISNGPENVSDTTTRAPPTQPETVVGANESGESRNESTTTEAPESQVNFSNESVNESATLRRMSSCGAQSDLSQCFQCHCGEECRLTFSGLQGADISFHVAIYQMEEKPVILWSEPWSITQKRADQVIAAAVAWQWPIRPSLRAAFSLGTGAAGDTQLALEITPRVVGANFTWLRLAAWSGEFGASQVSKLHQRQVAAWPPGFNFEGAHVQGATGATVLEAPGNEKQVTYTLWKQQITFQLLIRRQVLVFCWRSRSEPLHRAKPWTYKWGFSRFHAATLASEFVLEEVLNLTAFRIPGHVFVDNATLERVAPSRSTLPPLPVRLQEAGWLSMTFRLAQAVGPGTQLRLAASDAWELRAVGEGSGMSLYRVQDGQVAEILRLADVAAVSTMQVQAVLLDPMASMSAYTVTLWAMPLTYEAPSSRGAWTLDLEDGDGPIVTSNEGFQLSLPAWPLPSIAVQLDMASPPPGGRTYVQLGVAPWIGAGQVHLLLEPPPGWRLGASTSPLVSLGFADLTGGWEAQFEASASLWTTTDTRWYLLATADVPIFSKGELLTPVLSWSHVDGANVAPMQTTIQHANLADLQSTELILTLRLDQETPVKSIRIQPPSTYGRLTCADPDGSLVRGAPRWPMSLRRFGPSCRDEDNRTEVLLAQPVPVGFWLISLSVALPDEDPPDLFRVEVYDENQRLVDAATQVTVPALSEHQHWPVREAPTMLLRNLERQAIVAAAVVELSFQVDQEMTVEQGKIKAMLISLPNSVQFDEGISMSITGLPLERGTPTVSLTQAIIRLLEPELLQLGRKRVRFGVLLPRTEPLENIWSLEICSQDSCGGSVLRFPLPGLTLQEEPVLDEEVGASWRPLGRCLLLASLLTDLT